VACCGDSNHQSPGSERQQTRIARVQGSLVAVDHKSPTFGTATPQRSILALVGFRGDGLAVRSRNIVGIRWGMLLPRMATCLKV
jgi:hypothetical protein